MDARAPFTSPYQIAKQADKMRVNRRNHLREDTGELAELITDLRGRTIVCLVHNISKEGALIESSARILPKRVILNYKDKNIRRASRVVWLDGNFAGLEFF